ncbi:MAG: hypothetical protein HAW67_01430, partial [Endozoicomonadaceae bacterium]|nr:hypothetical protein [Endozoicomonadaceae bacterium]
SGLYYNYYRYYEPSTGKFITSDPIGLQGGLNTYAYAAGNPARYFDPFGLYCIFNPLGDPIFSSTEKRNRIVTDSDEFTFFFFVPVPGLPGPGNYPRRGGKMPLPGYGIVYWTRYSEEGHFERKYIGKQFGVYRCYGDCGALIDETLGFKDTDPEWRYDGNFSIEWDGPLHGPIKPPAKPSSLPPLW